MSHESPQTPQEKKPLPIDYRSAGSALRESGVLVFRRFATGVVIGVAVSACLYLPMIRGELGILILIVLSLKVLTCLVLLFFRGWRSFGLGLVTSVPVVVLIFLGVCALIVR
jgi:hypothetical protein